MPVLDICSPVIATQTMSIFWRGRPSNWFELTQAEKYAWELEEWIVHTWKQLKFPLDRHQLPLLPGIYSVYGRFESSHQTLPTVVGWKERLSTREDLAHKTAALQKPYGFNGFIYIGSGKCLYSRWESHDKKQRIRRLLLEDVEVDLYFYAMPPLDTFREESDTDYSSRRKLEDKLIESLCPMLNYKW